jgi:hypothetical protein
LIIVKKLNKGRGRKLLDRVRDIYLNQEVVT